MPLPGFSHGLTVGRIHGEPLASPEWCLLHAVAQGLALGDVCVRVTSAHPAADVGSLLASAIRCGWLVGFELS
jgi:hypothetical protein